MSLKVPVALLRHAFVAESASTGRRDGLSTTTDARAIDSKPSKIKAPRWWLRMTGSPKYDVWLGVSAPADIAHSVVHERAGVKSVGSSRSVKFAERHLDEAQLLAGMVPTSPH
jgi:hypothetical protein